MRVLLFFFGLYSQPVFYLIAKGKTTCFCPRLHGFVGAHSTVINLQQEQQARCLKATSQCAIYTRCCLYSVRQRTQVTGLPRIIFDTNPPSSDSDFDLKYFDSCTFTWCGLTTLVVCIQATLPPTFCRWQRLIKLEEPSACRSWSGEKD